MTRTHAKYTRVYVSGYDVSGTARNIGSVGVAMDVAKGAAYSDAVQNVVMGRGSIKCGPINAFLSPAAATGIHELMKSGFGTFDIMIPFGILGEPAAGVPMFAWKMEQGEYSGMGEDFVAANIAFPEASYAGPLSYPQPFGYLAHPKGAETGANSGSASLDNLAASTLGGIFCYQLFSSDGTVTLSLDDSANNSTWLALSGATSGSINASVTPASGMVSLSTTATVRRYLRWQLAFGTATTATFALGFIRGA